MLQKISKIEKILDIQYLLSLVVRSLYASIPNSESIKAVKTFLENFPTRKVATKVFITFLPLILTLNGFAFNCKNYFQIKGCSMGTLCAQANANLFKDHFKRKYIYPVLEGLSLSYLLKIL